MGCGGSKVDDQQLVILCRERKAFLKSAVDQRYALAASHMLYFRSLKDVGEALRRFVDEELVVGGLPPDSPVLTLPSDQGKKKKKNVNPNPNPNESSSSTSLTHSHSHSHHHSHDEEDSHIHIESSSEDGSDSNSGHIHENLNSEHSEQIRGSSEGVEGRGGEPYYPFQVTEAVEGGPEPYYYPFQVSDDIPNPYYSYQQSDFNQEFGSNNVNSYAYYMRSSNMTPNVVYEDPRRMEQGTAQWMDSSYSSYPPQYGDFGAPPNSGPTNYDPYANVYNNQLPRSPPVARSPPPAPPPPPPSASAWDFFNPFESMENTYSAYYPGGVYGVGSVTSSPDSVEVRQREGIPDLEDDTEQEPVSEVIKGKQEVKENVKRNSAEVKKGKRGGKKNVKRNSGEGTSKNVPSPKDDNVKPAEGNEIKSSSNESVVSVSTREEELASKKSVSFEGDGQTAQDGNSSKSSSLATFSPRITRDIQEVIKEIKDDFENASDHGKEVAAMLEVGKLPYQPRSTSLKVIFSRIQNLVAPSTMTSSQSSSRQIPLASLSAKQMAKIKYDDFGNFGMESGNLSSTLERLYVWEKKLYKEVKGEERLRIVYEKKCKRLKVLGDKGAEYDKIGATQASINKLLTKMDVAIKTVDGIARKIHKLRDEELQPQITELINGLIRMWKSMLKCHQKQFQAIIVSRSHSLIANIGTQSGSSLRATVELELELRNWCSHFNNWINTQKAYIESLNNWLLRCLLQEPEETPDGPVPFSPGRVGAPPVFIICNDWYNAMTRLSETNVETTMHDFALSLHQLWERQDEEQRQRLKADYLVKDFEKRLRTLRKEQVRMHREQDASSNKSAISVVQSESGVSPLDDLKVDLDSMRKRLEEEKAKHKVTVRQVHEAASSSLQAGLIPIFEALGNFTSDMLKAYEYVRVQEAGAS